MDGVGVKVGVIVGSGVKVGVEVNVGKGVGVKVGMGGWLCPQPEINRLTKNIGNNIRFITTLLLILTSFTRHRSR